MSYVISAYLVFYISIFIYATRLIIRCNHLEQENEDNSIGFSNHIQNITEIKHLEIWGTNFVEIPTEIENLLPQTKYPGNIIFFFFKNFTE